MDQERVIVFIDGSNLFRVLREVSLARKEPEYRIDYAALKEYILSSLARKGSKDQLDHIVRMYYYGAVPDDVSDAQVKYLDKLRHLGFKVRIFPLKHILATNELKEKGVDVALAMDVLELALEDGYDTAVVISHDEDFCELVDRVQRRGKRVAIGGFRSRISGKLIDVADIIIDLENGWDRLRLCGGETPSTEGTT